MPTPPFAVTALAALLMPVPATTSEETVDAAQANCDRGVAAECRSLAEQFFEGRGRPRSFVRAAGLYEKGCAGGDAKSCLRLSEMIARKQGVAKAPPLPPLYEKACAGGEMAACVQLGATFMPSEREPRPGEVRDLARALTLFEKACAAGALEACTSLGGLYAEGSKVAKDPTRAQRYLEKACAGGETGACWRLGMAYEKGTDVLKDEARAAKLYGRVVEIRRRSCAAGDALDCLRLGGNLRSGHLGAPKDAEQAARVLQRACELGEPYGCRDLGMMYDGTLGGLPRDLERAKALRQLEAGIRESLCAAGDFNQCEQADTAKANYVACDGGDPDGCFRVAKLYLYGEVKDAARAAHFLARGCDAGEAESCRWAAEIYATGQSASSGITLPPAPALPDLPRAVVLYQRGCDLGGADACIALGDLNASGRGVARDFAHAAALYEKACQLGGSWCLPFADATRGGQGTVRDPRRAAELYQRACTARVAQACHRLGLMYRDGMGVAVDQARAVKLLQEACRDDSVYDRRPLQSCIDACGAGDATGCQRAGLPDKAARLYESACGRGEARDCQALAQMYDRGELGRNRQEAATRFHGRACELGLARACYDLGVVYVRTDAARAVLFYEKACAGGEAEACSAGGYLLKSGAPNLPPDPARAEDLLARQRALKKEKR